MASNKKSALLKQNMREIAILLAEEPPKEEKARIKVESLIRDDYMIEAYDILSLNCELLSERIKLLQLTKGCPPDLIGCISTLMYAAPRVDGIPEMATIRNQFISKYGKQFDDNAMSNKGGVLNERVVTKLSIQPPAAYLVQTYLEQIADKFEVNWSTNYKLSADQMGEPMAPPTGYSVPIGNGTGLGPKFRAHSGMTVTGDGDNNNDDNDDDSLPPHFPYSGSLRNNSNSSFSNPNAPGGGGSTNNNNNGGSTTRTNSRTTTTSNTCLSSSSSNSKHGDDYNYLPTASLSYSGTSAAAKSRLDNDPTAVTAKSSKIDEASLMPPPAPMAPPQALPPLAPSSFTSRSSHNNNNNNGSGGVSVSSRNTTTNNFDKSAYLSASSNHMRSDEESKSSSSSSNNNNKPSSSSSPANSNSGQDSASYDDMAARFEALKNL